MPAFAKIEANIDAYSAGEAVATGAPRIIHRLLIADEIAVKGRARWDDKTNMILGACREHTPPGSREFCDLQDATTFFERLDRNEFHLASEATVAALGSLAREPQLYNPRPVCISGTCKTEKGYQHAALLRKLLEAADNRKVHGNITYRKVSFASDGEAKRGLALALEFMKYPLSPTSPIYSLLQPLDFMNLLVGPDDITPDKDYRHVIKALRSLLMRRMSINVLGFEIVPAVVKQHLRDVGLTEERIRSLFYTNRRQNVDRTYGLPKEAWSLPNAPPMASPTLSLREQLTHMSTAADLLLVLFTTDNAGANFMANQTFVNIMLMIKNAFFCVAKAKVDIPDSEFFLILLGTDRLEKRRASNITEVYIILGLNPTEIEDHAD
ncbi:hypothetical protein MVEN_00914300 [Mycena venus]|uniref:Uncharacterized protein n=1 Tax=Mycena venus TaxID=2733690 RepID=A0A8H7D1E8_9AGAR|nr:hypothetical protein MVEN_00914300 [Mycena venus]